MTDSTFPLSNAERGLPSAVRWSHLLLEGRIQPGDTVVDATAGNGHDTLFLAQKVGEAGHVFAFDLQSTALDSTLKRLQRAGIEGGRFTLLNRGHEDLASALPAEMCGSVTAVMFNLGYLPGSDHQLITQTVTTLSAVRTALRWIIPTGLVTVVVYPGHAGGAEEAIEVARLADEAARDGFEVQHLRPINPGASPPELWAFLKKPAKHPSAKRTR